MSAPYLDEIFQADGALRPPYARLHQRAGWDILRPSPAVAELLREHPLGDETRILPIPLVLDSAEYQQTVRTGVAQRALALQRFFADLVLGSSRILEAGPGLAAALPNDLTELRTLWKGHDNNEIRFVYGPDLVHTAEGEWMVLEDNVGCVGGSADGTFVAARYREATGLIGDDREADLAIAIRRWLGRIETSSVAAALGCDVADPWALRLDENARRRLILDQLGIKVRDRREGDALLNFDCDDTTAELFKRSRAPMFNAPGTGVLGDKALLPFMAELIGFYLDEEPILRTPHTYLLTGGVLPSDPAGWVVKSAAGCQGTDVFVLDWQPEDRLALIAERAVRAVAQRYVEPSRLTLDGPAGWDGYRVEIRPVAYVVGWDDVYVSECPVGKAISGYDSRRLNNVSHGACYVPVLLE